MIEVLKRLAELDEANGGVKESTKLVNDEKIAVITESVVGECGPMGMSMTPAMGMTNTPASFSINASAGSGDEVANMLTQIMTLAGVKKDAGGDQLMPHGHEPLTSEPPMSGKDDIRSALDALDQVEDEETDLGGMGGMGGDMTGMDAGMEPEMGAEMGTAGPTGDVSTMADQVRDMADELAGKDKEDLGLESLRQFDNSPQEKTRSTDPLNDFANIINKVREFDYVPAQSGSNPMKAENVKNTEAPVQEGTADQSLLSITTDLMKQYQAYKAD